jgi:NAD+ kinase
MANKNGPRKRVAVVVKRSVYDEALEKPDDSMHMLLERGDPTVAHVRRAHEEHVGTVAEVKAALQESGAEVTRIRRYRGGFDDNDFDLVITVGGDGTLLHASKFVADTPILGVNSAPSSSVGFFCGTRKGEVALAVRNVMGNRLKRATLTRMRVTLNDEVVSSRVLNDALFCHQSPAATSKYIVEYNGISEEHKSSGFWIGPAAGSTAAQRSAGGKVLSLSSKNLQLVVREPYTPTGKANKLWRVVVKPGQLLRVRSKSQRMRMYLDGPTNMVRVTRGDVLEFTQSPEPLHLLGISVRRKWGQE